MSGEYPFNTETDDAVTFIGDLDNSDFQNNGHQTVFIPSLQAVVTVAQAAAAAAEFAADQAGVLSGTSASSIEIGTGSKTFTTQAGKDWGAGRILHITSDADPTVNYLDIVVTSYSSTTLIGTVLGTPGGAGSHADWTIKVGGLPGTAGAPGSAGGTGSAGADGTDPGILLTWDDGNSQVNPGSGNIAADNDNINLATELYISKTNRAGNDIATFLLALDASTNTSGKGRLTLTRSGGNAQCTLDVDGVSDDTGFVVVAVSGHSGATGFLDAQAISLQFNGTGDAGAGAGDVTAASAFAADNRLIRSDGSSKGVQASGITIDDSNNITGVAALTLTGDPSTSLQAATKQYVDGLLANLGKRQRVRAATTANVTIATALNNGDALDGVTLATDDLVLVKNQSSAAENGIYVVGVSPARAAEFDTYNEHPGSLLAVAEGTANADTIWLCTSNAGGTLNSTALAFSKINVGAASTTDTGVSRFATTAEYLANTSSLGLSTDQANAAGALFALTDGASIAWNMASGFNVSVTLGGNRAFANPTNAIVGRCGAMVVTQDGTGTRVPTWGTSFEFAAGTPPVLSTAAGSKDVIFYWIQSSTSIIITGILKAVV